MWFKAEFSGSRRGARRSFCGTCPRAEEKASRVSFIHELMLNTHRAVIRLCTNVGVSRFRSHHDYRCYATLPRGSNSKKPTQTVRFDFNAKPEDSISTTEEHVNFKQVTANDLESFTEPPQKVKMLVRDYIEDSLYNPNYGYFPKQATIFSGLETSTIDFSKIRNSNEFQEIVAKKYEDFRGGAAGPGLQVFHTPTELFRVSTLALGAAVCSHVLLYPKPHYGQTIAQCIVSEYLLKYFPYEDLNLYEIGAGNGSLALDVLNFIQLRHPEVYERTKYTIIEISASLAQKQRETLARAHDCVEVVNKSIFQWKRRETAPCFIVMMEVIVSHRSLFFLTLSITILRRTILLTIWFATT